MVWVTAVMLVLSAIFLALGLILPLVRFETFYFFTETPSLVAIIWSLWQGGNGPLAVLVAMLSIAFPVLKLVGLTAEAITPAERRHSDALLSRLVPHLSRWSMTDVMLVAIVIFAAKTTGLASAFTQPGLWFYAGSSVIAGLLQMILREPEPRK